MWLWILLGVISALVIGPFLIPVGPAKDTVPPRKLADPDSRFAKVNGLDVHYKAAGEGEPALIMLHGFGASVFSWRDVLEPMARGRRTAAYDRPAFGLTERPLSWNGENPYSMKAQVELTLDFMDQLGVEKAILIGHSAGGAVAVETALACPQRIKGLVLAAPALKGLGLGSWAKALLRLPQVRRLGPLFVRLIARRSKTWLRRAWHNQATLTRAAEEGYQRPLRAENWDRSLWEFACAAKAVDLTKRLPQLTMPVLVITGDQDRVIPPQDSEEAASRLGKEAVVFTDCGHMPQEEYPEQFITAVREFLQTMDQGQ